MVGRDRETEGREASRKRRTCYAEYGSTGRQASGRAPSAAPPVSCRRRRSPSERRTTTARRTRRSTRDCGTPAVATPPASWRCRTNSEAFYWIVCHALPAGGIYRCFFSKFSPFS